MKTQNKTIPHPHALTFTLEALESEPLPLSELLRMITTANEFGYTVKSAHDTKSGNNPILAEIYSVWFAIENELAVFAHNIPWLIGLTGMQYAGYSMSGH